jgi:hypothetical protein
VLTDLITHARYGMDDISFSVAIYFAAYALLERHAVELQPNVQ